MGTSGHSSLPYQYNSNIVAIRPMARITLPKWRDGRYKALSSNPGPRALEFMMLPQATPLAKPNLSHAQGRDRAGPKRPMALTQLMKFSPTQSIRNIRIGKTHGLE